ncbi:hypothetical protein [Ethanoligenens sp.]|uniref:hypothetical protein n=1 Tax=Ethanoligenens sp. TaxID=2099655 RepID=UPI0039ECD419
MSVPRMRTAQQLAAEYKYNDPDTNVNTHFIRGLLLKGVIPYVLAGRKHLINADVLAAYLETGQAPGVWPVEQTGKIRVIHSR